MILLIKVYNENEKRKSKEIITLAYYTEALHRQKKLPDLKKLLKDDEPKKAQTANDMLSEIKKLNAMMGGETY